MVFGAGIETDRRTAYGWKMVKNAGGQAIAISEIDWF
jgi:hypothetical protein